MPGQEIFQPNPPPDPSQLDDAILKFAVQLDTNQYLSDDELQSIQLFRRAADYIAGGEFFPSLSRALSLTRHSHDLPSRQYPHRA